MRALRPVVFTLGAAAFFLSFFHRVAPAALSGELTAAFEVGGAALGALAATYFYIYMCMQMPTGILVDTWGPRIVLTCGGVVAGAGSALFGLAPNVETAAAGRTLVGLGVSVAFVAFLKLNANWFHERRFATATAFGNAIGIGGALLATAPLAWLITYVSWRSVFVVAGGISVALAAATWLWGRDHPQRDPAHGESPASDTERWWHGLVEVLRNRATWPGFWVTFGLSGSFMSFIGLWSVPFLVQTYGMTAIEASRHASVIILCSACSLTAIGTFSDYLRRRRAPIIASALLYLACWAAWIAGVPERWTYAMAAATGLTASGFSLAWSCAKEVNRPRYAGTAISVANTGGFMAAGILQPLVGWVLDMATAGAPHAATAAQFRGGLAVLALFATIGLAGALFIRETGCRNIWAHNAETPS
ncbi:MAG: MFS transporter [Rhodospirillaceae bacterium]